MIKHMSSRLRIGIYKPIAQMLRKSMMQSFGTMISSNISSTRKPKGALANDKRTLRSMAMDFLLNGEILYKRNHNNDLLRCINAMEAKKIIEEVHEGFCETHLIGHAIARTILRASYFWLTMENVCINHVRKQMPNLC